MAPTSEPSATRATRAAGKTPPNDAVKSTTNAPSGAPNSTPATTPGSTLGSALGEWRERLGTGVSRLLAPRPAASAQPAATGRGQAAQGAGTTPPRPSTGRVMLGMLAFVAGAELLLFLIQFIDVRLFKGYLENPQHTVAPHSTPILGGMTWFLLILMVLTLGLWITLNRLHIIQPLTPRSQMQASAARGRTTQATTSATIGRNRAARRAVEARGSAPAKGASAKAASPKAAPAKAASSSTVRRAVTGEHDAAYYRVKAAQRARKRRSGKR